jgi:hypothetical protein
LDEGVGAREGTGGRQNAAIHLQAVFQKARECAPSQLHFKEPNSDDFLKCRA